MAEAPLWRCWLSESAAEEIRAAASNAHPNETGGVLVGVLTGTRPWVTDAIHVPSKKATPTWYEIPAGARRKAVRAARRADHRVGYLGDWHAHPADVGPSGTDLATMRKLAADPRADCVRPLLVIARRDGVDYKIDARQFVNMRLRPLRVISAGALELPEARQRKRRSKR